MNTEKKVDRRIRKTKSQLQKGLLALLKRKNLKDITIKELVDEVDINRSTFYLHYSDIHQIMDEISAKLLDEISEVIYSHPCIKIEDTYEFVKDLFIVFDNNREIGCTLTGTNGDLSFIHKAEDLIEDGIKQRLEIVLGKDYQVSPYVYSFCRSGLMGLLKTWLLEKPSISPEEMAKTTYDLVVSIIYQFHPELKSAYHNNNNATK